ncbi:NUDIX hydrolase [Papillibacter cinnamivorans]|uniref:ADP-ribose pyrophosphatase n=1 Tax=Papillibacter cinnamivorans DSM 12816 TaxID=1122930 RepID=A0A1W2CP57_9FIRM|nr:NUDIX hydrolase [Papillibacter cinnamivorans]SMC86652.1 ADP-ribose pyrophosphatase [Papillibacter cinnamivorans DSM 12816]
MDLTERTIESETVYQGVVVKIKVDKVSIPGGGRSVREVVEHPGGVAILPLDEDDNVVTVTQYRYAFGKELLEIPAGKMEPGENPLECARRELREETGILADEWVSLGSIYASPGFCDEELHLFLARGLKQVQAQPDEDEFLIIKRLPLDSLVEMVMADEVRDAKTAAAVLKAERLLNR